MIEDHQEIGPLVETGDADLVWAQIDGHKRALGLRVRRGHIAVRGGLAFPVVRGMTSTSNLEEHRPSKCVEALAAPLRESGEINSAVFIPGQRNYYHFTAFNLPALVLLSPLFSLLGQVTEPGTVMMSRGMPDRARPLMQRLLPRFGGRPEVSIVDLPEGDYIANDVIFRIKPSPSLIIRAAAAVGNVVLREAGIEDPIGERGPLKLFVQRADAVNGRNLANQAEIQSWLEARGYVAVNPGDFSMEDQIIMFARATHVVAVEGAAIANLLFASNARKVLVLANANLAGESFIALFAKMARFTVDTLFGSAIPSELAWRNTNFAVPLDSLAEACARLDM